MAPAAFDHRAHLRLAYIHLARRSSADALGAFRAALLGFIARHGVPVDKYREDLTRAWIEAIARALEAAAPLPSSDAFLAAHPQFLSPRAVDVVPEADPRK